MAFVITGTHSRLFQDPGCNFRAVVAERGLSVRVAAGEQAPCVLNPGMPSPPSWEQRLGGGCAAQSGLARLLSPLPTPRLSTPPASPSSCPHGPGASGSARRLQTQPGAPTGAGADSQQNV